MSFRTQVLEVGELLPRQPRPSARESFVYVPLTWVKRAACLRCRFAVQAALLVWYRKSVTRNDEFSVSNIAALNFGLGRKQKAAGLKALQDAGMITLRSLPGRSPWVVMTQ